MRTLLASLTLCLSWAAYADQPLLRDGRIGIGADVLHDKGKPMAVVSYSVVSALVWSHNAGIALAYPIGRRTGLSASFGAILVKNLDDELVGTHLNFHDRVSYCGERVCLSFSHTSHGARVFGIRSEAPNGGLNFLFLEYRYR